jgi:hypothetical protein
MAASYRIRAKYPSAVHPLDGGLVATSASIEPGTAATATCLNDNGPREKKIALCHPGYAAPQDILLLLPAYDVADGFDSGGAPRFGIHHETARIACAVKANCRWDGYLSGERNNNAERVAARPDDVLLADRYYFHVPHTQQPSGICHSLIPRSTS